MIKRNLLDKLKRFFHSFLTIVQPGFYIGVDKSTGNIYIIDTTI